jgi:hypothetical protein
MLSATLRNALRRAGDPVKATAMQAYMKSVMPYHGVRDARFREERYAALFLAGDKRWRSFQTLAAMKMYEEMIVSGAWWDYVDDIASHRVGPLLRDYPAPMRRRMLSWVAIRLHRALTGIEGILPAEGDWLGAAPVCMDRRRRDKKIRPAQPRPPE